MLQYQVFFCTSVTHIAPKSRGGEAFSLPDQEALTMNALKQAVKTNWMKKSAEIRRRMLQGIDQLNDDQINWRFNPECNSIANIVVHIRGNIHQRIEAGFWGKPDTRDREAEFDPGVRLTVQEAKRLVEESFDLLENAIRELSGDDLLNQQTVRGKTVTIYDVLNQCIAHFSEHLGQVLYVAKMLLADAYVSTSIPKKSHTSRPQ
jgi:uncharacterized damage-inducible protein DinB